MTFSVHVEEDVYWSLRVETLRVYVYCFVLNVFPLHSGRVENEFRQF